MKIIINTTTDDLDPNATCSSEEQVESSLHNYQKEVNKRILEVYPQAEIEHREESTDNCIRVKGIESFREMEDIEREVQSICEDVYSEASFWEDKTINIIDLK